MASCKGREVYSTHVAARSGALKQRVMRGRSLRTYRCADDPTHFHNGTAETVAANNARLGPMDASGRPRG